MAMDHSDSGILLLSSGFKNIPMVHYPNSFAFVLGELKYSCPSFVAEFLSPRVGRIRSSDPTFSELLIQTPDRDGEFAAFFAIHRGENLLVNSRNVDFLKSICRELENDDFEYQLHNLLGTKLTIANAIVRLKSLRFSSLDHSREIEFIAIHFEDFPRSSLPALTLDSLYSVFSHPRIQLHSEDDLYNFISHKISIDVSYFRLFELVHFAFLSMDSLRDFIQLTSTHFEYFTFSIWEQLQVRLAMAPSSSACDSQRFRVAGAAFPFSPKTPLTGIIAHLTGECRGNVHARGVVQITASSTYGSQRGCSNVADLTANTEWLSACQAGQWLCYDFKGSRVEVTDYSIQIADVPGGGPRNFPKSWILEASEDGSQWIVLDERSDNSDLKGRSKIATFSVTHRHISRMIRIRQTGLNHNDEVYFGFRALELFGGLIVALGESEVRL
jgi:hypothetical protein